MTQDTEQDTVTFEDLPDDMIRAILERLDCRTLVRAGMVCKRLERLVGDNQIWRQLYTSQFGEPASYDDLVKQHPVQPVAGSS